MAIEENGQGAETEETNEQPTQVDGQEVEGGGEQEQPQTPAEIEALAKEMGWVPPDQYKGPGEPKDAVSFIRDGREIQRDTSRELKSLRQQLEIIGRTTGSLIEQQVSERVQQLQQAHAEAVEAGDPQAAFRISQDILRVQQTPKTVAANGPAPEAQDFAQRNASWFNKPGSEYATARAVEICNTLAAQGYDTATQLQICEQRMQQEMPQLFGQNGNAPRMNGNGKPPPGVGRPPSRGPTPSNRPKGFADLPKAAQDIAIDLEQRLKVPRDTYVKNYFANETGKA